MYKILKWIDQFIFYTIKGNEREYECCDYCECNMDCMCCTGCPSLIFDWSNDGAEVEGYDD